MKTPNIDGMTEESPELDLKSNPESGEAMLTDIIRWVNIHGRFINNAVADVANIESTELAGVSTDLAPEQAAFMRMLKARYERNEHNIACHDSIEWARIEAKLIASPEKLAALKRMDDSGGAPDMTGMEGDEFLFDELSVDMHQRRQCTYYQATQIVNAIGGGAKLMHPKRFKELKNKMKINMTAEGIAVWLDSSNPKDISEHFFADIKNYGKRHLPNYELAFVGSTDSTNTNAGVDLVRPFLQYNHFQFRCSIKV